MEKCPTDVVMRGSLSTSGQAVVLGDEGVPTAVGAAENRSEGSTGNTVP